MTPSPPQAMKGTTVKSSPESIVSRAPHFSRRSTARIMLAVASLMATISSSSQSRCIVSGRMSPPVRPGHVVDHDGEARVRADAGAVVLEQPRLVRLVVVGRDHERGVGADLAHASHRLDGLGGAVAARAGDHRDTALRLLDHHPDRPGPLGRRSWSPPHRWCRRAPGPRCRRRAAGGPAPGTRPRPALRHGTAWPARSSTRGASWRRPPYRPAASPRQRSSTRSRGGSPAPSARRPAPPPAGDARCRCSPCSSRTRRRPGWRAAPPARAAPGVASRPSTSVDSQTGPTTSTVRARPRAARTGTMACSAP